MGNLVGFPDKIRIVIGSGWSANAPFSEDDVLVLNRVLLSEYSPSHAMYSYIENGDMAEYAEQGDDSPSGENNRLKIGFYALTEMSPGLYAQVSAAIFADGVPTSLNIFSWHKAGMAAGGGGPEYSFKELWSGVAAVTSIDTNLLSASADYNPDVFKSISEWTPPTELEVDDATHVFRATSPWILEPDDATIAHTVESPTLQQTHVLSVDNATHVFRATSPWILEPDDATIAHTVENVTLTQAHTLAIVYKGYIPFISRCEPPYQNTGYGARVIPHLAVNNATHAHVVDGTMWLEQTILNPTGTASVALPSFLVTAKAGALGSASLPILSMSASGLVGEIGSGDITLPFFSLNARSGGRAAATLPALAVFGSGLTGIRGAADFALVKPAVSATGKTEVLGRANIFLPALKIDTGGLQGLFGEADIVFHPLFMSGHGKVAILGRADDIEIPLFILDASGFQAITGQGEIILPAFMVEFARGRMDRFKDYVLRYSRW